jgi:hypothetical protein
MRVLASGVLLAPSTPPKCKKSKFDLTPKTSNIWNAKLLPLEPAALALIRDRALSSGLPRLTTAAYHALVADAASYMRGDLPKLHVETLIAYVITRLDQHSRQADAGHQSAA